MIGYVAPNNTSGYHATITTGDIDNVVYSADSGSYIRIGNLFSVAHSPSSADLHLGDLSSSINGAVHTTNRIDIGNINAAAGGHTKHTVRNVTVTSTACVSIFCLSKIFGKSSSYRAANID
jgi:hypothetical protein